MFLGFVFEQPRLVYVELAVGGGATELTELKQRLQMVNLVNDLLGPVNPQLAQRLCLDFQAVLATAGHHWLLERAFRIERRRC